MSKRDDPCKMCGGKMTIEGEYMPYCKKCRSFRDKEGRQWKQIERSRPGGFSGALWEIVYDPLEVWQETIESLNLGEDF